VRPDVAVTGEELACPEGARYYLLGDTVTPVTRMVVFVPGSGCDGAFAMGADGHAKAGPEAFALKYASHAKLVVLEPPGIPRQFSAPEHGLSEGCPSAFIARSDLNHLLESYGVAIEDALSAAGGKVGALMFVGVSDGAVTAAALARKYPQTTHLTLISGFGSDQVTRQMEDLVGAVLQEPGKPDAQEALSKYAKRLKAIRANPTAELWQGQPEGHWASTAGRASSNDVAALPPSVQTLLVQGGADMSWPVANFQLGIAELLVAGRSTWVSYIPCADHHLICPGDGDAPKNLAAVIDGAVNWFIGGHPAVTWRKLP
jgi:pimeloyl-ACP methyl ester carboxylesterase